MNQSTAAYVLHARPYRDSSLLLELLDEDGARAGAVARGVRSGRGRAAVWQPFVPLWVSWGGRGELRSIRTGERRGVTWSLQGRSLYSGLYLNELLCRLLHRDDPQAGLFTLYEGTLEALACQPPEVCLRWFELGLLEILGYGLSLQDCADGSTVVPEGWYRFEPELGLVPAPAEPGALAGVALCEFREHVYSERARATMKQLCRRALQPLLGPRPLASRQLFEHP